MHSIAKLARHGYCYEHLYNIRFAQTVHTFGQAAADLMIDWTNKGILELRHDKIITVTCAPKFVNLIN